MSVCICGRPARLPVSRGRPGKYCSDLCRLRAFRERHRDETKFPETKFPDILFYCGLNECDWNHHPVAPGPYACVAPVYGKTARTKKINRVVVPTSVEGVIVDSAAFVDRFEQGGCSDRLSFEDALRRQIAHAYQFRYVERVSHVASYDLLIDEKWQDGERSKRRWSSDEAEYAVDETVHAAVYLSKQRRMLRGVYGQPVGLVLSAQGVTVEQYLRCARRLVPLLDKEHDLFGLGGWCITGLMPEVIFPSFKQVMGELFPFLAASGVRRVHVWGVIFPPALAVLSVLGRRYGVRCSTDSSGPSRYPVYGQWGYGCWRDTTYRVPPILSSCRQVDSTGNKAPTCSPGTRCRGLERARHVQLTRDYLARFCQYEPSLLASLNQEVNR